MRRCVRADVCLLGALDEEEVAHLNEFCDRTQETDPKAWGIKRDREGYHINQGLIYSQPWLDNPELDQYAVNHRSFKEIVEAAMGGAKNVRTYEFNFRESPAGAGRMRMGFHHVSLQRQPSRSQPSRSFSSLFSRLIPWACAVASRIPWRRTGCIASPISRWMRCAASAT